LLVGFLNRDDFRLRRGASSRSIAVRACDCELSAILMFHVITFSGVGPDGPPVPARAAPVSNTDIAVSAPRLDAILINRAQFIRCFSR
jgi:hypothetical protein